jgi:serine phosphatase RsbU (regulator of sigma subunit)/anti-sigma regulatory factor (Ser/Thr protein kinase)
MITLIKKSWLSLFHRHPQTTAQEQRPGEVELAARGQVVEFDLAPNDPLLAYLLSVSSVVEVEKLHLESPTLDRLRAAGVKVVVPLISQGDLIGLLNLGPRRSQQEYSTDDRRLLNTLAAQAAPALRVAQLARQQQAEARELERIAQELRVARVIQQTLLPREVPVLPGWQMAAYWQPARAVSGDFYDFVQFPDGRLAIIVGDVTDKGVPAALVMATTRSILRAAAERLVSPGAVLEQANNNLCPDMPENMFVTCLYLLLDPGTGRILYANAGHNLPYLRAAHGVVELRARGMPLGLMPGMNYEEKEASLHPGDQVVLYSDGLIEAHNQQGEMFGFPRMRDLLARPTCANELIGCLVDELAAFTGPGWEQEDDVTFVSLECLLRSPGAPALVPPAIASETVRAEQHGAQAGENPRRLAAFTAPSQPGNERQVMEEVGRVVARLGLDHARLERLKTAVAEATMNAMEHGNRYRPDLPVEIEIVITDGSPSGQELAVRIRDHGGKGESQEIPQPELPDLDAKLAGLQTPRGWGLFLIKNMVDEMRVTSDDQHHVVELILHLGREA